MNKFKFFSLFLSAILFVGSAFTFPCEFDKKASSSAIEGTWRLLSVSSNDSKKNVKSAGFKLSFAEEAVGKFKNMELASACRGLEYSQFYKTGNKG